MNSKLYLVYILYNIKDSVVNVYMFYYVMVSRLLLSRYLSTSMCVCVCVHIVFHVIFQYFINIFIGSSQSQMSDGHDSVYCTFSCTV